MTEPNDDFDWGELGREYWVGLGEQCGASEKQIRSACARHGGARDLLQQAGGPVALLSTFCAAEGACPSHLPLLHDVHKALMRDDTEYWEKTVARYSVHERVWLQKLLDNPRHQLPARVKLWRE